jgi:hypothetical protein
MKILLMSLALMGANIPEQEGYISSNGNVYPWCTENAIDPDKDGWGWENESSCKVWHEDGYLASNGNVYPWCTKNAIDPDKDGWGWENESSCKVEQMLEPSNEPTPETGPSELGIDDMPKGYDGLPEYGEGDSSIIVGYLGRGRGRVFCYGEVFEDEDNSYTAVVETPLGRYFADAGSADCAKNKAIMYCAFQNPLTQCEENVRPWG